MTDHGSAASGSAPSGSTASGSAAPARAEISTPGARRSATASVSAGIAAANAQPHNLPEAGPRFPAEDGGHSLAAMAERDLDATLQLLAERAQYITGASGAAIALRRGQHKDMLCRASTGSNAPELGALLSMEYGLSGESVRTRQILRCDDTERDARVNKEGCRQLGIASVVVMPVVCEEQAIGVFELFSGKANRFGERDVSALQRLSEMVEAAVKHATAMQKVAAGAPAVGLSETSAQGAVSTEESGKVAAIEKPSELGAASTATEPELPAELMATDLPAEKVQLAETEARTTEATEPQKADAGAAPQALPSKSLFWSAGIQKSGSLPAVPSRVEPGRIAVPAGLRDLQKCSACGFPVSQGRSLCVECEQKKWRGEALAQPAPVQTGQSESQDHLSQEAAPAVPQAVDPEETRPAIAAPTSPAPVISASKPTTSQQAVFPAPVAELPGPEAGAAIAATVADDVPQLAEAQPAEDSVAFLSSVMQSESWFAANKYVLAVLLVVGLVIAAVVLLR